VLQNRRAGLRRLSAPESSGRTGSMLPRMTRRPPDTDGWWWRPRGNGGSEPPPSPWRCVVDSQRPAEHRLLRRARSAR